MIDSFNGKYDWASNLYTKAPFYVSGQLFKSSEHYFMACKTIDANWCYRIMDADTPKEARKLGRKCPLRPGWGDVRINVMADALWYKFSQNTDIQQKLVNTNEQTMIEGNYWHDNTWGDCRCNNKLGTHSACLQPGRNLLGLLLMNLRTYFQNVQTIGKGLHL